MTGTEQLARLEAAIASSWSAETCFASAEYMAGGRPGERARGECGPTALVLQDWLDGELLEADVMAGSRRLGAHYWNRLPDGVEVDLTSSQFVEGEALANVRVVPRAPRTPVARGAEPYALLGQRVRTRLLAAGEARRAGDA